MASALANFRVADDLLGAQAGALGSLVNLTLATPMTRSSVDNVAYSWRRETVGSTLAARRAGI